MKVSVITVVKNRQESILRCLKSVQSQVGVDVEHIIQDGNSTDDTVNIIKEFCPNVSLNVESDDGIYDALNKAIKRATGDIVGVLHSDDVFADEFVLRDVLTTFAGKSLHGVYAGIDHVVAGHHSRVKRRWLPGTFEQRSLALGWMPPHPTLFLRASYLQDLSYDPSFKISGDYDFILRLFSRRDFSVSYLPRVTVFQQIGGASNGSLRKAMTSLREDYRAVRNSEVGGLYTVIFKRLRKLRQFWQK